MTLSEVSKVAQESAMRNRAVVFIHQQFGVKQEVFSWRLGEPIECHPEEKDGIFHTVMLFLPDGSAMNAGVIWRSKSEVDETLLQGKWGW
jgi:hypothetical protein